MPVYDFLIIGSGMAGAGLAHELAGAGASVLLLEREEAHGYHTTGRSAALYIETYGNAVIRGLTRASRAAFEAPPEGFTKPLLTPRGVLHIARADQLPALRALAAEQGEAVVAIGREPTLQMFPRLRADYVAAGLYEVAAMDIDVDALHQGFLRSARARGADIRLRQDVVSIAGTAGGFSVKSASGDPFEAAVVVNAAGAWADRVAGLAGARTVGLQPMRRTAVVFEAPSGVDLRGWPAVIDVDEQFYFKPEAGRVLASPADETPSEPCDAWAGEMDVAICIDRVQAAADLPVRRVLRSWAGLRSFVADRSPVIGFDPDLAGFFWLAGQGGYGVQTAPAAARAAAALARGLELPPDIVGHGVTAADLSPARLRPP